MSIRTERVARLVEREIAELLSTTFHDRISHMATVTGARVNRDLSIAYVYISCYGNTLQERQNAFRQLQELIPAIRTEFAKRIRHQLRRVPELRFLLDESMNEAARISELLDEARQERARRGIDEDSVGSEEGEAGR